MKRTVTEVIRRGLDSAIANWQLLAIRFAENIVFAIVLIGSAIALIVPLAISIGLAAINLKNVQAEPDAVIAAITNAFVSHWSVLVAVLVGALIVADLLVLGHSFVMGGCARTYVAAERSPQLRVFSMDLWMEGARETAWPIFWLYHLAYSIGALVVLIPCVLILAVMLVARDAGPAIIAVGCLGAAFVVFLGLVATVVTSVWCQKAIVIVAERALSGREALSVAWREMRADFGRHFAVAFIMLVLSVGGAMTLGMFSAAFSFHAPHDFAAMMFAPARIAVSMVQSVFTAAVGLWLLACFAAMSDSK